MKKISLLLLLSSLTVTLPTYAQDANSDFCDRFPLNSRCTQDSPNQDSSETEITPSPSRAVSSDTKILENLTLDQVENYLREIGYIDIKRNENNSVSFLMQGRPCSVFLSPKGTGVIISSYYPKTEQTTLEVLNNWNNGFRYSYAYIYETKEAEEIIFLDTNLTLIGGVTEERIKNFFLLHSSYQTNFDRYLQEL